MVFVILPIIAALFLSITAAIFSITGLVALFPGAKIAIIIMGSSLEFADLVAVAWTHKHWASKHFPKIMKTYMVSAILVLLLITSMGVFGFLAQSHTEVAAVGNETQIKIDRDNQQIDSEQNIINRSTKQLDTLDKSLDVYFKNDRASAGLKARKQQEDERKQLTQSVSESQKKIDDLRNDLVPLQNQASEQTEHLGPIKYVAELIFADPKANMDNAVRIIILMIVFVFQPLAMLLIIAANISYKIHSESKKILTQQEKSYIVNTMISPSVEDVDYFKNKPLTNLEIPDEYPVNDDTKIDEINEVIHPNLNEPFIPKESFTHAPNNPKARHWGYSDSSNKQDTPT